ncbi:MAG TPA: mannose-1-phosphate guanylyltransferase, partial [Lachnospiraceae bacterium]|nr:mannose-1-phosphate guanylyltransferase [Lachnospiraceae bacterium]
NVISGTGRVVVDGLEKPCSAGDIISLPEGCKHTVIAESDLQIIEVQTGPEINVGDKVKYSFEC